MRIGRALERLMTGRTSVTIAHRLTTAENADEVIVFDRGRVVQRGPHSAAGGGGRRLRRPARVLGRPAGSCDQSSRASARQVGMADPGYLTL